MSEDPSRTDRPALGAAETAASAARSVRQERVAAVLEGWEAVGRWAVFTGGVVQAGLLLVARIWLSQAVFVHQIMAMMRATGFSEAPSVGSTLIQSVAPLLLASGLATRPVALLLLFGVGRDVSEAAIAAREITIMADKSLPYEVLKKVMATCTDADYGKISLAVLQKEKPVTLSRAPTA